jgi:hypothetical protein
MLFPEQHTQYFKLAEANQRKVADERSTRVTDVSDDETVKGVVKKVLPRQHVQSGPTGNVI